MTWFVSIISCNKYTQINADPCVLLLSGGGVFYNAASAETILYQMVDWFKNGEVLLARIGYFPGRRDSQFSGKKSENSH